MESNRYYDEIECVLTLDSKKCFVKQNSGIKFGVIGAVLFIDNNKFIYNLHKNNLLNTVYWSDLAANTTIIFKTIKYTYNGTFYPDNMDEYNECLKNPTTGDYLISISNSFIDENDISFNVSLKPSFFNISNPNNSDISFDGVAFISIPYIQENVDVDCELYEKQNIAISMLTYFPDTQDNDKKIWLLSNQSNNLVFNVNNHIHFTEDKVFTTSIYTNNKQDGIHIINNGATYTIGGTTNLLIG